MSTKTQHTGIQPPQTPVRPVDETFHGVTVTDPYRWLEDGESDEVRLWTEAQNAYTRHVLDSRPEREPIRNRLAELLQTGYVQAPVRRGGRYFFLSRTGDQNQAVLSVREGQHERVLVDPASLREDGTVALDWWYPSRDGALLVYGLSESGDEQSTLHILDVASGTHLGETIDRTRFCGIAWLPDNSGLYYTRYPAPGSVPAGEERYHRSVFLHRLGTDPDQDLLVYADPDPQGNPFPMLARDGRYLMIACSHGWSNVSLLWRDLQTESEAFTDLTEGIDGIFNCIDHEGVLYIHTNWDAPRYRVLRAPLETPTREHWQEIIPEGQHALQTLSLAGNHLVTETVQDAVSHLHLYSMDGVLLHEVPLPAAGTVYGPTRNPDGDEVLFAFTSFAYPVTAFSFSPVSGKTAVFGAPQQPTGLHPASIRVEQVWFTSRDGTRVPMFVVSRTDLRLDGGRPTILTGYGGFNISRTPEFGSGAFHLWIEYGGIYALANLRGGSEYGEAWHEGGMLDRKQNVFDDFVAAGDWLVANGYTNPAKLACWGGSNGGLLVGAAITQRPDLFQAALCAVPLLDMLRYHHFQIARLWIPEYGSSEDAGAFAWLHAYSPYHHVQHGVEYPATLFMTAESDSRVDPLHARKMAALLQAQSAGKRPILLRVESRAGHGAGKPISKLVEEQTDAWTFIAWQLGLDVAVPR